MTGRRVLTLAWKSLWMHRLRSLLTALGIVFGVWSVVAMLAIGEGASQEAQDQIRRLGSRNILIASVRPAQGQSASDTNQGVLEYGLQYDDLERIRKTVPDAKRVVARRDIPVNARYGARQFGTVLMGTHATYVDVANLRVASGRFLSNADEANRRHVCVLGDEVANRLFLGRDPVGQRVRLGSHYYTVVGVLEPRGEGTGATAGTGGESDRAAFVPLKTQQSLFGDVIRHRTSGSRSYERVELHRITVEAADVQSVPRLAKALRRLVARWHPKPGITVRDPDVSADDVRMTVPLELLRQAEETKRIFTIVLASIAGISLLVGGIGIMNIMLASVVERTREIGIRRALGARRGHIIRQFLAETVVLSVGGGLIGLVLGVVSPFLVTYFFGMKTVVTPFSLVLAFGMSAGVGLVFGMYPAARAADLDPVEALRRE